MLNKLNLILLSLIISLTSLSAQVGVVEVKEENRPMSKGSYNALVTELPNTTKKTATNEWKSFVKKYKSNAKYDRKSDEYFADDATLPEMSDNSVDIYARFYEEGENVLVVVWFNLGVNYLKSEEYPQRYQAGVTFLKKFASISTQSAIEEELKAQEKALKDMEKDFGQIEKEQNSHYRDIDKQQEIIREAEEEIRASEEKIAQSEEDKAAKTAEMDEQQAIIDELERALQEVKARNKKK